MAPISNYTKLKVPIEKIGLKTILGVVLIALSVITYLIFESTNYKPHATTYLIPIGVAFFGIGFHLALSKIKALQSIKKVLTFIVIGILAFGIFTYEGWDQYILSTSYAMTLAEWTTNFTVFVLNLSGIHVTQNVHSIIFPPGSKIPQVDVLPACAGLQEISIFLAAFGMMLIDLSRKTTKKKLAVIFVLGTTGVFFANLMRILFLVYVGYAFGFDALETNHLYAGTIIFLSLIAVFWWLSLRWISKKPQAQINQQDVA